MRNLGLIISFWLAAISLPSNVLALGLGGIEVNSFLNQPLSAEIEVISTRSGEIDDLLVGLASRDAFTRAGLTRTNNLSDLRFAVKKNEEGDSAVILVTTKSAIKEPFLNFLVEADWSKGRLLREFTILLDPPFYADSPAPAPQPEPVTETVSEAEPAPEIPEPIVESTDTADTSSEQVEIPQPIALSESDEESVSDEQSTETSGDSSNVAEVLAMVESVDTETGDVTVSKGDTLWSIASGLQGSGHSMSQIMLAIQRVNPEAFGDDNINNLKVGSVLRMPDASEMGVIDEQQAYAEVLQQNGLWDDYVARVTGEPAVSSEVETDSSGDSAEPTQETESSAELNLLAPGDGESDAAGMQSEGEDANELRVKLALAEEELDASRVENQELESRIAELEARLSKFEELQKMVEIEDDSLAQLQADQAQEEADQTQEEVVSSETIEEQQKAAEADELLDELLTEETTGETATTEPAETTAVAETDGMVEDDTATETTVDTTTTTTETTEDDSLEEATSEQEQTSTAPPVPVIVTESEPESTSLLDGIIPAGILDMLPSMGDIMPSGDSLAFDPIMLGGFGGIILLLIGLVIYKRRKSGDDDGEVMVNDPIFVADVESEEDLTPIHLAEGAFEGLEDDSDISLPDDSGIAETLMGSTDEVEEEDDEFARTAVVSREDMPEPEAPAPAVDEQDDILNEADVYLAYNLYDNAEELLTQSLETNPERADYRSKLLDTHFATKNADAFIREAETLKSMGNPANRYWDRVLVMGYELAPDNQLFAAAKDSDISTADLEISKPAVADFDLGASEDDTNFSTTDFDLGEEDTNTFEATDFSSVDIGSETAAPELSEDDTKINVDAEEEDVPDEIGDLDFSFDADDAVSEEASVEAIDDDAMDFELPEDLDLGSDDIDVDPLSLIGDADEEPTAVIEAGTAVIDTEAFAAQLQDDGSDDDIEATAVLDADNLSDGDIDFGMDDTAMMNSLTEEVEAVELDLGDFDADDEDSLSMDIDMGIDNSKTDTFAPGDFEDPNDSDSSGFDDIEDLMLPDDVDEVSTKLDLARAFIDMGDAEGARSSLDEVMTEGNDEQKTEAQSLLDQL